MFERFTPQTRAVVVAAQDEARALRHPSIGTEDLLLAVLTGTSEAARCLRAEGLTAAGIRQRLLAAEGLNPPDLDPLDPHALATLGIDLDAVRRTVEEQFGQGALRPQPKPMPSGHIPFSKPAKHVLELAVRETVRSKADSINSLHLLIGLIQESDAMAARLIREHGVDADDLLSELRRIAGAQAA